MGGGGGTKMYCPHCKSIQVCMAISPSEVGKKSARRWYRTDHPDINWFRRGRQCLECQKKFVSSEVNEDFIDELVELRDALKNIKEHSEKYIQESTLASNTLKELTDSLEILRALKIYKET
jgi:hypothetical protein